MSITKEMKFLLFFSLLIVGALSHRPSWNSFPPEDSCSRTGGICVHTEYCNEVTTRGLCPNNQDKGAECCHSCKFEFEIIWD